MSKDELKIAGGLLLLFAGFYGLAQYKEQMLVLLSLMLSGSGAYLILSNVK